MTNHESHGWQDPDNQALDARLAQALAPREAAGQTPPGLAARIIAATEGRLSAGPALRLAGPLAPSANPAWHIGWWRTAGWRAAAAVVAVAASLWALAQATAPMPGEAGTLAAVDEPASDPEQTLAFIRQELAFLAQYQPPSAPIDRRLELLEMELNLATRTQAYAEAGLMADQAADPWDLVVGSGGSTVPMF